MKVPCATCSGPIRMTAVAGVSALVVLVTLLDKTLANRCGGNKKKNPVFC